MAAATPEWIEIAKGIAALVQVALLLVAAVWGYYKFLRSKTLDPSIDVDPTAEVKDCNGSRRSRR